MRRRSEPPPMTPEQFRAWTQGASGGLRLEGSRVVGLPPVRDATPILPDGTEVHPLRMSVEEFLAWPGAGSERYELFDGEIVAMAPCEPAHAALAVALTTALTARLRRPCRAYSEAGIRSPLDDASVYVPDVLVSCASVIPRHLIADPVMVAEILWPSTRADDRGPKLDAYRAMPSVVHVLLLDPQRPRVEHWQRGDGRWWLDDLGQADVIRLAALSIEVPLAEIYEGIA